MKILINKTNLLFSFLLFLSAGSYAQGLVENELTSNGVLIQKYTELVMRSQKAVSGGSITDTLNLGIKGFKDDFSNEGPYPDTARWLNNYVYVNRDYPIAPPTLGAATFDGVNENGYPYDFSASQSSTGKADTLTSKPIDLYLPGDTSVYFSFYYQPQGRGNAPEPSDSLILEFKDPAAVTKAWKHIWAVKGRSLASSDSTWKLVMLHVTDARFLQKGFQFRFTNWATLSGNGDQWNIDYVYLNKNRTKKDTIFHDVAFVYNTPSLTQTYTAIPWRQYAVSDMKTSYSSTLRNNDTVLIYGGYGYKIFDQNSVQVNTTYSGGNDNFTPFITSGYVNIPAFTSPALNYTIPALTSKTKYTIESYINASPNDTLPSDTVRHTQFFDNYYAYDDGTAEISFGLAGSLNAQIAEKYTLAAADTLRAVDIYFNPQWVNASLYTFKLKVWALGSGGSPGSVLFSGIDSVYRPAYNQNGRNIFVRYFLQKPVSLNGGTTFFIGIEQNTVQPINIGVDKNNNSQSKTYYNTSGTWQNSPFAGSLMMHPVLGSAAETVGIDENAAMVKKGFIVYPNPANDKLFISFISVNESDKLSYTIYDVYGRIVLAKQLFNLSEPIDVSAFSSGIYFIRTGSENSVQTSKFIISK